MTRTYRKEPDGKIVRDGKAYLGKLYHDDPWDVVPYNRSKTNKEIVIANKEYEDYIK